MKPNKKQSAAHAKETYREINAYVAQTIDRALRSGFPLPGDFANSADWKTTEDRIDAVASQGHLEQTADLCAIIDKATGSNRKTA